MWGLKPSAVTGKGSTGNPKFGRE
ncbi:hypothetical protein A2U01_0031889, partial [Trifolium medium]|nr:hypothetical protein [Trifolium medium]